MCVCVEFRCSATSSFWIETYFMKIKKTKINGQLKLQINMISDFLALKSVPYHILKFGRFLPEHHEACINRVWGPSGILIAAAKPKSFAVSSIYCSPTPTKDAPREAFELVGCGCGTSRFHFHQTAGLIAVHYSPGWLSLWITFRTLA